MNINQVGTVIDASSTHYSSNYESQIRDALNQSGGDLDQARQIFMSRKGSVSSSHWLRHLRVFDNIASRIQPALKALESARLAVLRLIHAAPFGGAVA